MKKTIFQKIICLPDLLRTSQRRYTNGFFDLIREPIWQGTDLKIGYSPELPLPDSLLPGFDASEFRRLTKVDTKHRDYFQHIANNYYTIEPNAEAYLFQHIPANSLLLTFEIPPWMANACHSRGIDFISFSISPLRFSSDLYPAVRTSNEYIYQRLWENIVSEEEIRLEAATLAANVRMHKHGLEQWRNYSFKDLDNSLIFLGQQHIDASLLAPGGISLRFTDYADTIRTLSQGKRILYKPHPFAQEAEKKEIETLAEITGTQPELCQLNAYQILSTYDHLELVGLSSGLLQEAAYFDKKAHTLFQPFIPLTEAPSHQPDKYLQIHFQSLLNPAFWHTVLAPQHSAPVTTRFPSSSHNHAREIFDVWWDYSKVITWERQLPLEIVMRGNETLNNRTKKSTLFGEIENQVTSKKTIDEKYLIFLKERLPQLKNKDIPENFKTTDTKFDTLRYCLAEIPIQNGLIAEFGVYKGNSINLIAKAFANKTIHGFDSFEGFPEDGRNDWKQDFSLQGEIPKVADNVVLYKGYFHDTLPAFFTLHKDKFFSFLHIDCDIYSSTATIFEILGNMIKPGCIIVFDELLHYHGFLENEMRAFYEFLNKRNLDFEWIGIRGNVLMIEDYFNLPPIELMKTWRALGYEQEVALRII